jgi:glutaconate CoA-transferase, subunit A
MAPHECSGGYEPFFKHMDSYTALVNQEPVDGLKQYLDRYIYGPKTWNEYLNLIGLEHLLEASRGGRSIFND